MTISLDCELVKIHIFAISIWNLKFKIGDNEMIFSKFDCKL